MPMNATTPAGNRGGVAGTRERNLHVDNTTNGTSGQSVKHSYNGAMPNDDSRMTFEELAAIADESAVTGEEVLERARQEAVEASKWASRCFTPAEIAQRPPKPWLIRNVIGPGDLGVIFGAPGEGKSFVALDLAASLALGGKDNKWALQFDVVRPTKVALFVGEGMGGFGARVRSVLSHHHVTDIPNLMILDGAPQLYWEEADTTIEDFIREVDAGLIEKPDLVIIDTLNASAVGADENSAKDMGIVIENTKLIRSEWGSAVLIIHHKNKNGTERGSTAIRGAADVMIEITKPGRNGTMSLSKLKDGYQWDNLQFELIEEGPSVRVWWKESDASPQTGSEAATWDEKVIAFLSKEPGKAYRKSVIRDMLGMKDSYASNVLAKLVSEGAISTRLNDPNKPQNNNHNPVVYYVEPDNSGDGGGGEPVDDCHAEVK